MTNKIVIDGKTAELSDETVAEIKKVLGTDKILPTDKYMDCSGEWDTITEPDGYTIIEELYDQVRDSSSGSYAPGCRVFVCDKKGATYLVMRQND